MKPLLPRLLALTVVLALGATLALWLRPTPPPATQTSAAPASTTPAHAQPTPATPATDKPTPHQSTTPSTRTETISPATQPPTGTARSLEDRYASAPTLDQRATAPDSTGRFTKNRLVQTTEKYPYIRIEEQWQRDPATGQDTLVNRTAMVADHLVVRAAEGLSRAALETALAPTGARIRRAIPGSPLYLIQTPRLSLESYDTLLASLSQGSLPVAYAEPDYVVYATLTPNDPSFGQLWGLHNTGQTGGQGDADIDATEAWDISRGSNAVLVAVIDTGIDHTHPDLAANMWTNPGEIAGNNIDDDGNGYIDDTRGWDFVNNDNNPIDDQGHGTHCAGTIGAVGNNGIGVAGVAHTVRLVAAKFLSASGGGYTSDAIESVLYTTSLGVTLTSNSWGGGGYSQALKDAIDAAQTAGILFVAAAGNDSFNTDSTPSYPAAYNSANIISVAATDHRDQLAYFSNYGAVTVDLAAPGVSIYSTYPGGGYSSLSGTSMACPHVAGAAALLKAANPAQNWAAIKNNLLANTDQISALSGKVATGGRLNIGRTLIVSSGPYVSITSLQTLDGSPAGSGNADGIANPGETIALPIDVQNLGSETARGLSTSLSVITGSDHVQLLSASHTWPDLDSGASEQSDHSSFLLNIPAGTSTPLRLVLRFTTTDDASHSWSTDTELVVYTRSTISGRVTALTGGSPIAGATVSITSTSPALTTTTNPSGDYTLSVLDGTHTLRATAPGYNASTPLTVSTPGNQTGQNFTLGRARLQVSPQSLSATQYEDTTTHHTLTVSNTGDQPLQISLSALSLGNASLSASPARLLAPPHLRLGSAQAHERAEHFAPAPGSTIPLLAPATLPFRDGFEDGTLAKWDTGYNPGIRETTTAHSAVGTTSAHLKNTGADSHNNGLTRTFPSGSKPRQVSFWVRTASTTSHSAYFVLRDSWYYDDIIWFFAEGNGRFYVNTNVGGDSSYAYQADTWYRIEFRNLDWDTGRFDYHVNGTLVKAAVPFRSYYRAQADSLHLYNFSSGSESWFDDIRVLDDSARWLGYTPDNLTLTPGQSATVNVTLNSADLPAATYPASLEFSSNDPANPVTTVPVSLTVTLSPNTPPVAAPQSVTLDEDTSTTLTLTGSDAENHNLAAHLTSLPTRGTLYQTADGSTRGATIATVPALITNTQKKLIYVPNPDASGSDSFQFVMKDKRSESAPAAISLSITPVNDTPLARNDTASGLPGQGTLTVNVLSNDSDADNDTLTLTAYTQGVRGSVTSSGGTLLYTPSAGFDEGVDTFTYTISDGHGGTSTARVSVYLGYLAAGDWPTYAGNNARNGQYPASLAGKPFVESWRTTTTGYLNHLIVASGRVFTLSSSGRIDAIELATGLPAWAKLTNASYLSGLSHHQQQLYYRYVDRDDSYREKLLSIDSSDGSTTWTSPVSNYSYNAPRSIAVTDDTVYTLGGNNGTLHGINRATGTARFSTPDTNSFWTPTLGDGALYQVYNNTLVRRSATTGAVAWTYTYSTNNNYSSLETVAYDNGRVFFSTGGTLYAINVSPTGASTAWSVAGNYYGLPAVANGRVYTTGSSSYPYYIDQYDASTGALLGQFASDYYNLSSPPIVTNDTLIASTNYQTRIYSLSTRALLQTIPYGGQIALSNGALVIAGANYSNSILCYRVNSGTNAIPQPTAQTATGPEDQPLPVTLTGTDADGDPLAFLITSLPNQGTLHQTTDGATAGAPITQVPVLVTHPQGKVVFRPHPDGFGSPYTSFNFKVNDGVFNSAEATITINISNLNDAPSAHDDTAPLLPGRTLANYWPTANDTDPDGDPLTLSILTQPARGSVVRHADNSITYTPQPGFISGTDTFDYTLADGSGLTDTARVTIAVNASAGLEWPTLGGSPAHAGRQPLSLGTSPLSLRWEYTSTESLQPLAAAGGRLFLAESTYTGETVNARSLDAITGAQIWEKNFAIGALNQPSHHNGTVYLQRNYYNGSQFFALDAATGTEKWNAPYSSQGATALAPAVSDLGAYISGGTYGGLYGFTPLTGSQKFFLQLDQESPWTPSIYENGVYSYVGRQFRSHHPETGAILWQLTMPGSSTYNYRTVAFDSGRAFLTADGLVCIDLATQSIAWRIPAPANKTFTGTPAIMEGIVYALCDTSVMTYAASSGVYLGEYNTRTVDNLPNTLSGEPVVTGDLVIVSNYNKTYLFNRATRASVQTFPYQSTAAIADGVLYLTGSDKKIRAYTRIPAGNLPPSATPMSATLLEEASVTLQLEGTDPDADPIKFAIRSLPANGTLYQTTDGTTKGTPITRAPAFVENTSGFVIYQAPLDVTGSHTGSFTFSAHDPYSSSTTATARIDLTNINDAPIAIPDTIALRPGEPLTAFRPQDNDRDADNDTLTLASFTQPTQGTVTSAPNSGLTWTPPAGLTTGTTSFNYTVRDPSGSESSSTVTITVSATFGRDWPTFGNGPAHTGHQPVTLGTASLAAGWTRDLGKPAYQLAISDGRVFASTQIYHSSGEILALDRVSGDDNWRVSYTSAAYLNAPSTHAGSVYMQLSNSSSSRLYALNATDGATRWTSPFSAQWETYLAPAVSDLGVFINGGSYGGLYGFNRSSGSQLFFKSLDQYDQWTPALHDGRLYSFVKGIFRNHDLTTGEIVWSLDFGWRWAGYDMNRTVACDSGRAFLVNDTFSAGDTREELIAIDLTARQVAWRVRGTFTGTPATAHQTVYVISAGRTINAYDQTTGRHLGAYTAPNESGLYWQPVVTNDTLIAASTTKTYLFDLKTRQLRQTLPFGGMLSLAGHTLYLAGQDNVIRTYSALDPFNRAPSATPSTTTTNEDTPVTIQLQGADPEAQPLKFHITRLPLSGSLYQTTDGTTRGSVIATIPARIDGPTPRVIYVPDTDLNGSGLGNFGFTVHDGEIRSAETTATVHVTPVNDAPLAVPDTQAVLPDTALSGIRPADNDRDVDGDTLQLTAFTQPAHGTLAQASDASLSYTPATGYTGTDTFNYTITDSAGSSSSSTVTLHIDTTTGREWTAYGASQDHTGYQPVLIGPKPLSPIWRATAYTGQPYPHLVVGGRLIARGTQSSAPDVASLNPATGTLQWSRPTGAGIYASAITARDGTLVFSANGYNGSTLQALDHATGTPLWSTTITQLVDNSFGPALTTSGLYFTNQDGAILTGHNRLTGAQLFTRTLTGYNPRATIGTYQNSLYMLSYGAFEEIDSATGASLWSLPIDTYNYYDNPHTPAFASGHAFFVNTSYSTTPYRDTDLIAVNLATRSIVWRIRGKFRSTPAIAHRTVYIALEKTVQARDQATGRLLATYTAPANSSDLINQPIVTNDRLIATDGNSYTHIFDLKTRELLQTIPQGGSISLAGNTLYIASYSGLSAWSTTDAITFSPAGGTFPGPINVTLTASTPGATIYYTTDGTAPASYNSPFLISGQTVPVSFTGTIRAITTVNNLTTPAYSATFTMADTDADNLPDWWENLLLGGTSTSAATTDSDNDGTTNEHEFIAGTNPLSAADRFIDTQTYTRTAWNPSYGTITIAWPSKTDRLYTVERSENMKDWYIAQATQPGTGSTMTYYYSTYANNLFFRVRVSPKLQP